MANNELLDQVMEHIEQNQELWNQGSWARVIVNGYSPDEIRTFIAEDPTDPACGTALCFAGHACSMSGWNPVFEWVNWEGGSYTDTCQDEDGNRASIEYKAAELLGLDDYTAATLFAGGNDLDRLKELVERIKENGTLAEEAEEDEEEAEIEHSCDCDYCDREYED